jgi:hypothetical protein
VRTLRSSIVVAVAVAASVPAAAMAGPAGVDTWTDGTNDLTPNTRWFQSNSGAQIDDAEPWTANGDESCTATAQTQGSWMGETLWWHFTGTGGRVTVSTFGSSTALDTLLAVYEPDTDAPASDTTLECVDDLDDPDGGQVLTDPQVTVEDTIKGAEYLVQVGDCDHYYDTTGTIRDCGLTSGSYAVTALTNDQRAFPESRTGQRTTVGASSDPAEHHTCNGADYGKTVWFRYHADRPGWVTLTAGLQFYGVLAIYRGADVAPLKCAQNSMLPDELTESLEQYVTPGDYFIQVGGELRGGVIQQGQFGYTATFRADLDVDRDSSPVPSDCNDGDPGIHPGAPDVPYDGIDQDCLRGDNRDVDNDGHEARVVGGDDCDDNNGGINPDRTDKPGNGIDEDCVGGDAPKRLSRDPQLSLASARHPKGRIFAELLLRNLVKGERVEIRCRGSRGCPKRFRKTVRRKTLVLRSYYGAVLRPGARIEVFVTMPGNVTGWYVRVSVRRPSKQPARRFCDIRAFSKHTTENCG